MPRRHPARLPLSSLLRARTLCLALTLCLSGCLSLEEALARQAREVATQQLSQAYDRADQAAQQEGADRAFWHAEAGTLALWLGESAQSLRHLADAEEEIHDLARRRYGASATDTAKALALNDCALPYAPYEPELTFLNLYKALAYGALGNPGAMRVELNRVRQRQFAWFVRCAGKIAETEMPTGRLSKEERQAVRSVADQAAQETPRLDPALASAVSAERPAAVTAFAPLQGFGNAYAAHLTGVVRWCAGDAPRNDLALAAALAPASRIAAADAALNAQGQMADARVWIYVEDGLAPKRIARPFTLPYPSIAGRARGVGTISFDVPKLVPRAAAAPGYTAEGVPLEVLTEVDPLIERAFEHAWPGMLARQVARTLLRVALHEGGQGVLRATGQRGSAQADALALLWSLIVGVYDIGTNAADLRCADLLPKRVWVGSLPRPAAGALTLCPTGGRALRIPLGEAQQTLVWVRYPAPGTEPTVLVLPLSPDAAAEALP